VSLIGLDRQRSDVSGRRDADVEGEIFGDRSIEQDLGS
jgi:hypothetical protein